MTEKQTAYMQGSYESWKTWKVLESPGTLLWHFPGLESPGRKVLEKEPLVLESSGNLLNSTKNMKCMEGSKEN